MNVHFWGVRGSIPTPLSAQQIRTKLYAALQRIKSEDIESDEAKLNFISSLPWWISGTAGGNTPCVELVLKDGSDIIFDAGSGMRVMGKFADPPAHSHYHLFMSHFHWDHIQGLPFFDAAYNPNIIFDVYSPYPQMKEYLETQMSSPFFPVPFSGIEKHFNFHLIEPGQVLNIGTAEISCTKMGHPGDSYSYAVVEDGKKFVYATDIEIGSKDFVRTEEKAAIFENADVILIDSQYTVEESLRKVNWGHSAFCYAIDFAFMWKAKKVFMFHHEPTYDDRRLNTILESAKWYANYVSGSAMEIDIACEGAVIEL
ncbi:MBL fold metallo-hydrolase [uncultured Treponema sp.]|uniref:MBL fold metallo-hydrolase n=1 Tax=uncultured Treponema sp. TaxID=162155 RepID=UPI0025CC653A|nr:MBL fold metallo-hydrolase [uncultured Treponema sp.]